MRTMIVKLGGSLLDWPALPLWLRYFLDDEFPSTSLHWPLFIVGGGSVVEALRFYSHRFQIGEEDAHWLAIEAMGVTARLMTLLIPGSRIVATPLAGRSLWERERTVSFLNTYTWMHANMEKLVDLPRSWEVTSDSIAACVAQVLQADLILIKSVPTVEGSNPQFWAERGFVDRHFPAFAPPKVRVVCPYRDGPFSPDPSREGLIEFDSR